MAAFHIHICFFLVRRSLGLVGSGDSVIFHVPSVGGESSAVACQECFIFFWGGRIGTSWNLSASYVELRWRLQGKPRAPGWCIARKHRNFARLLWFGWCDWWSADFWWFLSCFINPILFLIYIEIRGYPEKFSVINALGLDDVIGYLSESMMV